MLEKCALEKHFQGSSHLFQDKAYEYWRKGCDNGVKDAPCARACLNAGLLDSLDPGTKIGGFPGFKNPDKQKPSKN